MRRLYTRMRSLPLWGMLVVAQSVSAQSTLSGRVVNSVTKAGIPDVEISFCQVHPAPNSNTPGSFICDLSTALGAITDDTGSYHFGPRIPEGQYGVGPVIKQGYVAAPGIMAPFTVSGDTHHDIELMPLASLHGRVLDPEGNPAPGYVVALDSPCNGCTAMQVSISNQDGEYSFTDLPPVGSFVVSVSPKAQDPKLEEKIVTTYYPSAIDRDLAQGISSQGTDLLGYDIKLRTTLARSVRGIVLDDAGNPVPKALVSIVKPPATGLIAAIRGGFAGAPLETPIAEPTETLGDGTFSFPSVVEGTWMLRVVGGQPAHVGSTVVKVGDSEVEGVEVRIAPAFDIVLQTDWGEKPPVAMPANPVNLIPIDTPRPVPPPFGNLEPGEVAHFRGFSGSYFVAPVVGPAGYYLAQALLDNRDVLGQVTPIEAGDTLKLMFRSDGGSVRGTVEKGAGGVVILMADATASGRLGYLGRCDGSGAFVAADLPPGEYTAIALPGIEDPNSADFATKLQSSGKRVKVEAGSAAQVDLRLAQ